MKTTHATPYIFAALVVIVLANAGLATTLGAHPFWSVSIAWIGTPIGLVLALTARWTGLRWTLRTLGFFALIAGAFALAVFGKQRFVTSVAGDTAAGHMWYFGWIAVACFSAALIATAFGPSPTVTTD